MDEKQNRRQEGISSKSRRARIRMAGRDREKLLSKYDEGWRSEGEKVWKSESKEE